MAKKYTYKGTKITGTSTTAKVFKKSGVKNAKKNDTYFNTETGHNYICTEGGSPKDAKWKYVNTGISAKPEVAYSGLAAPVRGNNDRRFTCTWKVPAALTNTKNGKRAEEQVLTWTIDFADKKRKDPKSVKTIKAEANTTSTINLSNVKIGKTTYTRESFYPYKGKPTLNGLNFKVEPKNSKGTGKSATATRKFTAPRAPSISAWQFNDDTGEVSCTITTDPGADYRERLDTWYKLTVTDSSKTGSNRVKVIEPQQGKTATSFTVSYDVTGYQGLTYDEYVKVHIEAWARGYAGDSAPSNKYYYVAFPAQASIIDVDIPSLASDGKCTVLINTNQQKNTATGEVEHPTDKVKLEYLANVEYSSAEQIPGDAAWTDSGIVDDGQCTALTMPVGNLLCDAGKYTYLRVVSYRANEAVLMRYSPIWQVDQLHVAAPTAEDDYITILDSYAGADGKSAVVFLGWDFGDTPDDSTGTELSWDTELDAWKSTKEPSKHEFTWYEGPITKDGVTYRKTAKITIKGLDESETYYITARRYMEGDEVTYSPYCEMKSVTTNEMPESVVAIANENTPYGKPYDVYWTFAGKGIQTKWGIVNVVPTYASTSDEDIVIGKAYYTRSGQGTADSYTEVANPSGSPIEEGWYEHAGVNYILSYDEEVKQDKTYYEKTEGDPYVYTKVDEPNAAELSNYYEVGGYVDGATILEGEGGTSYAQIDAERLNTFAVDNKVSFYVRAAAGSEYVNSQIVTTSIVDAPTLSISVPSTIYAQSGNSPIEFDATVNTPCDLAVVVTSQGAVAEFPTGQRRQVSGDTIHSDVYSPEWDSELTATITLPTGLDFWDLGKYSIEVVATDRTTSLKSEPKTAEFDIDWTHKAPDPFDYVTITPVDTVDDNGFHIQACDIALTPPAQSLETDFYDIYRLTGDGAVLIGSSFPLEYTVRDLYAPFGESMTCSYRVAIRTADGDVEFNDIEYVLESSSLRLDWSEGSLEFPYNLSIADTYKKDIDIRQHMDGSTDGYWNQNIQRSASLSTDVIRIDQQADIDLTRQLARYAGPVFVRTPEGTAYEADVQVTDMSGDNNVLMAIAFDATEIGVTDEFILPTPYIMEEAGGN